MIQKLILTHKAMSAMQRHVTRRAPLEACGLLAGKDGRVELVIGVHNAARSPTRYLMSPTGQYRAFLKIEGLGLELLGIYHSHPKGPDHPSPTDIQEAMYPVVQVIWSAVDGKWQAAGFWIEAGPGQVSLVTLQIVNESNFTSLSVLP
jgi:proteasome lid subunit RPN8/RPN11